MTPHFLYNLRIVNYQIFYNSRIIYPEIIVSLCLETEHHVFTKSV